VCCGFLYQSWKTLSRPSSKMPLILKYSEDRTHHGRSRHLTKLEFASIVLIVDGIVREGWPVPRAPRSPSSGYEVPALPGWADI
jgi:hypothetical protein